MSALDDFKQGVKDDLAEQVLPPPSAPLEVARILAHDRYTAADQATLRHWRDDWWQWQRSHWAPRTPAAMRAAAYAYTADAVCFKRNQASEDTLVSWAPNRRKIVDLLDATAALAHLDEHIAQPAWLDGRPDPGVVIACANGLLVVDGRRLLAHTPAYFNAIAVPFAYDPTAPAPAAWLRFLDALWPDDPEAIRALQEFFGYILSGRLDLHKIWLLVGPPRGGKGVITRLLRALIGAPNVAGPTLSSLAGEFGLQPLLGKSLAVVSDARLGGRNTNVEVVERLLSISGEDSLSVPRKHQTNWEGQLPVRFLFCSNELPQLTDASAAIAGRFVPLTLTQSWLGREDPNLERQLHAELPSILNWALDGLDRLTTQEGFTMPQASHDALSELAGLASPTQAFLAEYGETGPDMTVALDDLWQVWASWAEENGHPPGTKQTFARNVRAAVGQLQISRPGGRGNQIRIYRGLGLNRDGSARLDDLKTRADLRNARTGAR